MANIQECRFSAVVNYKGKSYYVDCTNIGDMYYELMVFPMAKSFPIQIRKDPNCKFEDFLHNIDDDCISWTDLFCERFDSVDEAEKGFDYVVKHISEVVP